MMRRVQAPSKKKKSVHKKRQRATPAGAASMVLPRWISANPKGRETRELILRTALAILIDEGYQAMSLRRIAEKCKIRFGNLTYHYRSREDLVTELLESVLQGYEVGYEVIISQKDLPPEERLVRICKYTVDELRNKQTTRLFPELWALSNHNKFVFDRMHALYRRGFIPMKEVVEELRPDLSGDVCTALAMFMCISMEGLMVFAGYEKPFMPWIPAFENIAARSFIDLLKNITAEEVGKLTPSKRLWQ
jgi:AcrR family transcriptional regulator